MMTPKLVHHALTCHRPGAGRSAPAAEHTEGAAGRTDAVSSAHRRRGARTTETSDEEIGSWAVRNRHAQLAGIPTSGGGAGLPVGPLSRSRSARWRAGGARARRPRRNCTSSSESSDMQRVRQSVDNQWRRVNFLQVWEMSKF